MYENQRSYNHHNKNVYLDQENFDRVKKGKL